jgi:NADH dehydrogenase
VGILDEHRKNTFSAIHVEAADRISRIATEQGVAQLVHFSALGADIESESEYAQTKAEGEAAIELNFPSAMILRPSVIFGPEDEFFNRFAGMSRFGPVLPIVGADTKLQPVYVDDVANAAVMGVLGQVNAGIYELGGQDVDTFRGLMERMLDVVQRRRLILNIPNPIAKIMAMCFSVGNTLSLGIVPRAITGDQIKNLETDNVVSEGAMNLETLGIKPTAMAAILPDYLWRFRTSGQYNAIKDSAKNLRNS